MTTCKMVYLDEFGIPSSFYERMVEKHGPVKGEELYIRHMIGLNNTQFSEPITDIQGSLEAIDKLHEDIIPPDNIEGSDKNYYYDTIKKRYYNRTTEWIGGFPVIEIDMFNIEHEVAPEKFNKDVVSLKVAEAEIRRKISREHGFETMDASELEDLYQQKLLDEPLLLEAQRQDIINQWDAKAKYGTFIHGVMEKALLIRNDLIAHNATVPDLQKVSVHTWDIATQAYNQMREETYNDGGIENLYDIPGYVQIIETVLEKAAQLERQFKKPFIIKPEAILRSDTLGGQALSDDPRKKKPGLAGSADILFVSEDGLDAYVGDFKTKDDSTLKNFDRVTQETIGGPFGNIPNNAEGKAEAQISVYAAMLKEMGFNVLGGSVFIVNGVFNPEKNQSGLPLGERKYRYSSVSDVKVVPVTIHTSLDSVIQGKNVSEYRKLKRENGAHGMIEKLSGGRVSYIKDNEKVFIRNYHSRTYPNKSGRIMIPDISSDKDTHLTAPKDATKEEIDNIIRGIFRRVQIKQLKMAQNIKNYFKRDAKGKKEDDVEFSGKLREAVDMLLGDLDPSTHDLHVAEDFHSAFAGMGPDVLVAVNKDTGDISLLSAITSMNNPITFSDDGQAERTSMYGKYFTDQQLLANNFPGSSFNDTKIHDFINLKLAIGAVKYRQAVGLKVGVENIKTGSVIYNDRKADVTATDMETQLNILKQFSSIADAREDIPEDILAMIDGKLGDAKEYKEDFLTKVSALLASEHNKKIRVEVGNLQLALEEYSLNPDKISNLITRLAQYSRSYKTGLGKKYPFDKKFMILSNALLSLVDIDLHSKQLRQETMAMSTMARSPITAGDYYTQKLYTLYNSAAVRIQEEMKKVRRKNEKLFSELLKSKGISRESGTEGLKAAFSNMYVDFDMKDSANNRDWMKLKDPKDPQYTLSKEEKAYINFFNETTTAAIKKSKFGKKGVDDGSTWTEGLVPVYNSKIDLLDRKAWKSLKNLGKAVNVKAKKRAVKSVKEADKFEYSSGIEKQMGDTGNQHSAHRRRMLGIDPNENSEDDGRPDPDIEQNLAIVVMNASLEGSQQEHMQILADVYGGMDALLTARSFSEDIDSGPAQLLLFQTAEMIIHNRYKAETGKFAEIADKVKKYASQFMFTVSTKQAMLETATQAVNSTSAVIQQIIKKAFKQDQKFTLEEYTWSATALLNEFDRKTSIKLHTIVDDHNMINGDPANFKSSEWQKIKKWGIWQSKVLRGMNSGPFNHGIRKMVIAQMKHLGIIDAYENVGTDEDPVYEYNEKLDKRFYVYHADQPDSKTNRPPKTDEEKHKHASWKFTRKALVKEGLIDENGKMMRPLIAEQRVGMKQYATKLFGSFGKDAVIMAQFSSTGRILSTYKGWFAQKLANYYTKNHISEATGQEEHIFNDETGEYDVSWKGNEVEGIIQSVNKVLKEIEYYKLLKLRGVKLTPQQEDNLTKLLSDSLLLMFAIFAIIPLLEMDNPFMNSKFGQTMKKSIVNAGSELNIIGTTNDMAQNSAPILTIVGSALRNTANASFAMITGDVDAGVKALGKGFNKGGIQTVTDISELLTD